MKKLNIFLLICFCGIICLGVNFEKDLAKAEKLIEKERFKSAISKLEKLYSDKKISEKDRGMAAVLLARAYRGDEKYKEAVEILEKILTGRPYNYHLELGESYLALEEYYKAISASMCHGSDHGILFFGSLWIRARAIFGNKKYLDCMNCCQRIIKGIAKLHESYDEELKDLVKKANDLYKKALELYEIERYGMDYVWYRKGRESEFENDFRKAVSCYGKIKGGILKDAGQCYTGHCLERIGQRKEALKTYSELYDGNFLGLYRGEALYHAAILNYLDGKNKEAMELVRMFGKWFKEIKQTKRKIILRGINKAIKQDIIVTAPREFLRHDDCGNLIRTKKYPGSINNRLTAPWYLPYYGTRAELLYGFLLGESGEYEKAASVYKDIGKGKRIKILSDKGTSGSLLAGLVDGVYLLPKDCSEKLSSRYRNIINLACFYYVSEEKLLAENIFNTLSKDKSIQNKTHDMAAVLLGQAYCLISSGKWDEAGKMLSKLHSNSKYRSLPVGKKAAFLHACLLSSSRAEKEKAFKIFEELANNQKSALAPKALLAMATCAINYGDREKAFNACESLLEKHIKTPYADAAKTLLEALKKSKNKKPLAYIKTKTGKVIKHRKTIVIPGTSDWELDTSKLNAGDVVFYKIKCIPRDNCLIVSSVKMTLTEHEPKPPSSKGDEISFVRAPVLFVKNLSYNFKERFPGLSDE